MSGTTGDVGGLWSAAQTALAQNRLLDAEKIGRDLLRRNPADVGGLQLLAEIAVRAGRTPDAERLLEQALTIAPQAVEIRHRYALLLLQQNRFGEALSQARKLLELRPSDLQSRELEASILAQSGNLEEAIARYTALLGDAPDQPFFWMRYANALRAAGQQEKAIGAYRKAAILRSDLGEAWCSLANLKTFRFAETDIAEMQTQVERADLGRESRTAFHFALGKALGDAGRFDESFDHYAAGNALWRSGLAYNAESTRAIAARCRALFTEAFFASRRNIGNDSDAPIFIVGLPRAGSTLVEQILASHSAVEGLGELPDIMTIAARLDRQFSSRYPVVLSELAPAELKGLGNLYLESARPHRKQDRPRFTDKMPNNFLHIGMIRLILPRAKIVDVRRSAMACCFSNYSHHFARGQEFTYDLGELGRFYRDYESMMEHYAQVLPGAVHRVSYEALIENPETEIRALLDYLDLPFEEACLRHFETARPISSASSEQVRLPLYRASLDYWRHYEPWLAPLQAALDQPADLRGNE